MGGLLDIADRAFAVMLGAGGVQILIFLMKRRSELRGLDAAAARTGVESGSVVVTSAERLVALADKQRDQAIVRADLAEEELHVAQEELRKMTRRAVAAERRVQALNSELEAYAPPRD